VKKLSAPHTESHSIMLLIMEIPPEKKPIFYLVSIPVFVAGLVLGALIVSYVFFKTKDRICPLNQLPEISTELNASQMQQAMSVEQNRTIFGKVLATDAGSFTLQFFVANPLDSRNSTTTSVKIPFDPKVDEVFTLKKANSSSTIKETKASFSDIQVGGQVLLKILDGKKTVYITPS